MMHEPAGSSTVIGPSSSAPSAIRRTRDDGRNLDHTASKVSACSTTAAPVLGGSWDGVRTVQMVPVAGKEKDPPSSEASAEGAIQ